VFDNRMLWEPWVEPAESFHKLKEKLHQRGFTNLPMSSSPVIKQIKGQSAETGQLPPSRKSMLQKGS
jgi:D-mannonate dehydratase